MTTCWPAPSIGSRPISRRGGRLGDLVIEDYELAAWQFMQMCQATLFQAFVFQAKPAPSAEQIAKVVDSATRMFLVAYRAKTD